MLTNKKLFPLITTPDLSHTNSAWVSRTEDDRSQTSTPSRRFLKMRTICISTVAVVLLGVGPLLAANNATLIGLPRPSSVPNTVPDRVHARFLATSVWAGATAPPGIVPWFNCVTGPDIHTLLLALPFSAVFQGQAVT